MSVPPTEIDVLLGFFFPVGIFTSCLLELAAVAAIAGGIIVAVVAVVALVFFCILILYLHRTG